MACDEQAPKGGPRNNSFSMKCIQGKPYRQFQPSRLTLNCAGVVATKVGSTSPTCHRPSTISNKESGKRWSPKLARRRKGRNGLNKLGGSIQQKNLRKLVHLLAADESSPLHKDHPRCRANMSGTTIVSCLNRQRGCTFGESTREDPLGCFFTGENNSMTLPLTQVMGTSDIDNGLEPWIAFYSLTRAFDLWQRNSLCSTCIERTKIRSM